MHDEQFNDVLDCGFEHRHRGVGGRSFDRALVDYRVANLARAANRDGCSRGQAVASSR